MNIGFIVDASNRIGFGHWSRCLNLSKILQNKKNYFISRNYPSSYKKFKSINLIKMKKGKFNIEEIKNKIHKFNITALIIDNYKFNYELQKKIKSAREALTDFWVHQTSCKRPLGAPNKALISDPMPNQGEGGVPVASLGCFP